eukprot:TRINITY_DN23628_c0_g1_i1.p1 TRINITY_DN23628_c0_g1~~TRINITY_DN23628_c0_g1_i1.p1  ORF type:complete len:443 (+),score=98.70 TRINITY_DN23628_c0_g1_i1:23-1330(+)
MEAAVAAQDPVRLAALVQERLAGDASSAAELLQAAAQVALTGASAGYRTGAEASSSAAASSSEAALASSCAEDEALLTLQGISLALPRGRFDLVFSSRALSLRGKGKGGSQLLGPVAWSDVMHVFKVPKQECITRKAGIPPRSYLLVLVLARPLVVGKQEHRCIVVNADGTKPFASLPEARGGQLEQALAQAKREDQLAEHLVFSLLFGSCPGVTEVKQVEPELCSLEAVQAWRGVESGYLYPLRSGLLFLLRPATFISSEDMLGAEAGSGGGPRGGELVVHRVSTKAPEIFSNVGRGDMPVLLSYLSKIVTHRGPDGIGDDDDDEDDKDFEDDDDEEEEVPVRRRARTRSQLAAVQQAFASSSSACEPPAAKRARAQDGTASQAILLDGLKPEFENPAPRGLGARVVANDDDEEEEEDDADDDDDVILESEDVH